MRMNYSNVLNALFVRRLNRFAVSVMLSGREVTAHLVNSGRLRELLVPGSRVGVVYAARPGRKTDYTLVMTEARPGLWVSADARLPNTLFRNAFYEGRLDRFGAYTSLQAEKAVGASRLDFVLQGGSQDCFVEVKSVTLVQNRLALFPDAPTERGRKHVRELTSLVRSGYDAAVVFIVQRPDADAVMANREADKEFYTCLNQAQCAGVSIIGYRCVTGPSCVSIEKEIPVIWEK